MALECPRCKTEMHEHSIQGVDVEYCKGCFGLWLEAIDVEKVTRNPFLARFLHSSPEPGKPSDIDCPSCGAGLRLQEVCEVELDTCPRCRGTWFDFGEIEKLHRLKREDVLMAAGPRKKERMKLIDDLFSMDV